MLTMANDTHTFASMPHRGKEVATLLLPQPFISQCNQWGRARQPFLFLIDFKGMRPMLWPLDHIDPNILQYQIGPWSNCPPARPFEGHYCWQISPPSFARYAQAFELVQAALHRGDSYLINLTWPTKLTTDLSLYSIFAHSEAWCRLWWRDHFTVFSPEKFVCIQGQTISTYPMKGTIDARLPYARARLLADEKERSEHMTIVDLLRNDLSQLASNVHVRQLRYLELVPTRQGPLWQASSEICGSLSPNWPHRLGHILATLLPAGSVTGAPKRRTVELIEEVEPYARGYYTGIAGIFDGQSLYSAVLIRFIEQTSEGLIYKSGGGITTNSVLEKEYEELIAKVYLPLRQTTQTSTYT